MKTCKACGATLTKKPHETNQNFEKRRTCNRKCQAHARHGTEYKLREKPVMIEPRGVVPRRIPEPLRSALQEAIMDNPELPLFLLECVEPGKAKPRSDAMADYSVG